MCLRYKCICNEVAKHPQCKARVHKSVHGLEREISDLQAQLDAANEKGVRLKQLTIDAETKYSTERYEKKCLRNQLDSSNGERETYFRNCKDLQAQLAAANVKDESIYKLFIDSDFALCGMTNSLHIVEHLIKDRVFWRNKACELESERNAANAENKRLNEAFENLSKSTRNEIDCANEQYAILEQQLAHERKVVEVLADMVSKAYPKRYKRGCSESFSWAEWAHEQVRAEG